MLRLFAIALVLTGLPVQAAQPPVTYTREIAPILHQNCTSCHHTGGSGPFSLMDYEQARRWGSTIGTVTQSRYMPPWLPAPGHGDFAGTRRLSDHEIALITSWIHTGMPEGEPLDGRAAAAPKPPVYASAWQLGPPDLILEVDSPMEVPASGTDLFRNFILPFPGQQTRWVRAMEIRPGSPQVVHHANLIVDRAASLRRTHPDWKQGIPGMDVVVDAGERFDPDGHFLDWKPDSTALLEPEGMPWRLDPGNDLVLNMHLKPTGKVETVRAQIGLYFTPTPATRLPILVQLEHDAALNIPAGDPAFSIEDHLKLPEATDLLAIYPHAHYLGKRLEGWVELPNGTRRSLILIDSWDIDRQSIYRYRQPVPLPAGTVVHMRYTYDNSAANPHNLNNPPIRVTSGNRSADEMGHLWLQLLPRAPTAAGEDARAPILRAWMENILRKNPADPTALFNLAALDLASGNPAAATTRYRQALAARPNDARLLTALAASLDHQGIWKQAAQTLHAATLADQTYFDAHFDLASIDLKHALLPEAEEQFRAAIALSPSDPEAHAGLGSALLAQGRAADAQTELAQAAALAPTNPDTLVSLAMAESSLDMLPQAVDHLKSAIQLDPTNQDARRGLVAIDGAQGKLADAIREQQELIALAPTHPDLWNDLGVLFARNGDRAAAEKALNQALKLDPTNAEARQNLTKVQALPR